jgi:hypothetical protein
VHEKTEIDVGAHGNLMTVKEIAGVLRVPSSWVYDHADELGGYRLGKYLRFDLSRVFERLQKGAIRRSIITPTQRPIPNETTKGS